jgi:photoactive yellow protein
MKEIDAYPLDVKLLEQLLDDLPIGALILDDQGIIRRFNKYEEQLSGLPRHKTIGKSFFSEVAPCTKDIELGPKFHEGIANGSLDLSVEFSFPYPYNRVPRDVFIRAKSIRAGGEVAHIVLIEDITSRRQLERNNAEIMAGLRAMLRKQGKQPREGLSSFGDADAIEREACILHAELLGFRRVASKLQPSELFPVIDARLREAVDIIHRRGGRVDVVQGDSLMAYFLPEGDGRRMIYDAARAAWAIAQGGKRADFELPFRVGLSHGQAFNGVIGRSEFGNRVTIGQPIMNARVMAQVARANELIVDGPVLERLGDTAKTSLVQGPGGYAMPGLEEMRRIEELTLPDEV